MYLLEKNLAKNIKFVELRFLKFQEITEKL